MTENKKALVIDDEDDIREILSEFCSILNFDTETCSNGKEGLDLFLKKNFDVIISDIKMPDMDGYEFVEKIRQKNNKIPIIICSGYIDNKTKNDFLKLGATHYLEKPFKFKDFQNVLKTIGI